MPPKLTTKEFIARAKQVHGDYYDYSKVDYKTAWGKVIIICPEHGEFLQAPINHTYSKAGCPTCGRNRTAIKNTKTTEVFISRSKVIHHNKYDYSKVEYTSATTPVVIVCSRHGEFELIPNAHLNGHGCPICKMSKGELKVMQVLISLDIPFEQQKTFRNCKNKRRLSFDFYCKLGDTRILIEYDGSQHFYGWTGKHTLPRIQRHDAIKNRFAAKYGFTLIRIPFTEFDNILAILHRELSPHLGTAAYRQLLMFEV